jgi:hypothetical protein
MKRKELDVMYMTDNKGPSKPEVIRVEVVYGGTDSCGLDAAYRLLAREVWDRARCDQQYTSELAAKNRQSMDIA